MIYPEHREYARKYFADNPPGEVDAETLAHLRVLFGVLGPRVTSLSLGSSAA